jgi:hypothetical protein
LRISRKTERSSNLVKVYTTAERLFATNTRGTEKMNLEARVAELRMTKLLFQHLPRINASALVNSLHVG